MRQVAEARYDFVKLTLFITPPVYDAVVDEAAKRRIPVVGHVDPQVGVARALEAGPADRAPGQLFRGRAGRQAPRRHP